MMNTWGADVYASPSDRTLVGRNILQKDPKNTGSLGIAISEAIERAASDDSTKYALGSVLNHVKLHQTIIGQEAILQMEKAAISVNMSFSFWKKPYFLSRIKELYSCRSCYSRRCIYKILKNKQYWA